MRSLIGAVVLTTVVIARHRPDNARCSSAASGDTVPGL